MMTALVVAALYVESAGCYAGLPDVEVWDRDRDARTYAGPHPVVGHPPCERWGRYWAGGPTSAQSPRARRVLGDDGGCFAACLAAVRQFGGVLEHPAASHAWQVFGLAAPRRGGWCGDLHGGWSCEVHQGHFGHRGQKATWLYACKVALPSLPWGDAPARIPVEDMGRRERLATPHPFRDLLLSIARTARPS